MPPTFSRKASAGVTWRDCVPDPERLARAAGLERQVERVGAGVWLVRGEYHVQLDDLMTPPCDCGDVAWRDRLCKHAIAVLVFEGIPLATAPVAPLAPPPAARPGPEPACGACGADISHLEHGWFPAEANCQCTACGAQWRLSGRDLLVLVRHGAPVAEDP